MSWPQGKRRHVDRGNWSQVRLSLTKFLDDHWTYGQITRARLARDLDVSSRTVTRWLDGTDRPAPEYQEAAEQWLIERRQWLRSRPT